MEYFEINFSGEDINALLTKIHNGEVLTADEKSALNILLAKNLVTQEELEPYQLKSSEDLSTTAKEIVPAINEIKGELDSHKTETSTNLDGKVDKAEGKSLLADTEIARLLTLHNYNDTEVRGLIDGKASNDHNHDELYAAKASEHTHENKEVIDNITTDNISAWNNKVDKEEGKSLVSNTDIEKLGNLENYDDTEVRGLIDGKADISHNHDEAYAAKNHDHNDAYASLNHNHDSAYATADHNHDGVYAKREDLHTHTNFGLLESITTDDIADWNNKATESFVKNEIAKAELNGSGGTVDLSGFATKDDLETKADVDHTHNQYLTEVPSEYITETELNAKGYLTEHQDISGKADKSEIPTNISQLTNDSGFITEVPSEYITETELNAKGYLTEHQSLENYALKNEIPTVPTKTSQLTNDSGYITNGINELNIMSLILGNYQIKYNSVDDTLDFLYKGAIDEPTKETIALTWAVGNLDSSGAEIVQDNALRSDFVAIETGYTYSFNLGTSMYDPTGVRVYFYDTNRAFISRTDGGALGYTTGTDIPIDIPSNAAYMRFKCNVGGTTTLNNINTLLTLTKANDEIVIPTWHDGKSIAGGTGEIIVNEAAMVTDPIAMNNNYNYTIRYNPTTTNEIRIVFYDSSQTYISRSDYLTSGNVDTVITFPGNTAYFRIKTEKVGITVNEANDNIIIKKVKKVGGYVTEGLSMYIDATRGSIRDVTANHTITNNGVTHTSDNNYLNFVSTESDYLGTDFVPNLTQWSAEVYFQYTSMPTASQAIFSWGVASDNNIRLAYSSSTSAITLQSNAGTNYPILSDSNEIVKPHHLIITKDNGTVITYLDGVKSVLVTDAAVQTSHNGTLNIGARYNPTKYFADMNLRMFRFYDGKVLSDEEALRNYNYELKNSYVREGLSMHINASDVATHGSIRDITGKQSIVNHGVSTTLDNGCLNFVASNSNYIDTGFIPNLTTWSLELYFYFTDTPSDTTSVCAWGLTGNKVRIGYSGSARVFSAQTVASENRKIANIEDMLSLRHLIVTMDNGTFIAYLDGVKIELATNESVLTSHTTTMKIGGKYNASSEFANIHLKSFRFYDGKVLTEEEALQNYRYETKNNYVTNGLSLYIDAQDVATQGSVRDITSRQNVVNHGVSTTLDNDCLNFVASESDYIDCGFKPNLNKWSLEYNFYLAELPSTDTTMIGWGASGNRTAIGIWDGGRTYMIAINDNTTYRICTRSILLSLAHIILTYDNGKIIAYVNGEKSQIATNANVMTSQASNLIIGTKYSAADEFTDIHLKSLRFYDGKVLTDEEALQNYNYELNRDDNIISVTWIYNQKPDSSTGELVANENNACTEFISYDSSYNYTLAIDTVAFFRVFYYSSSQSYISNDSITNNFNGVITPPENTEYMRLKLSRNNVEFTDLDNHVILRKTLK